MARPLEFERDAALAKGLNVFWTKGYEATTLTDLTSAMGLSKSSFYLAFKSKQALYETLLSHYSDQLVTEFSHQLNSSNSAYGFLESLFLSIADTAAPSLVKDIGGRGCFLSNSATELSQTHPRISLLTTAGFSRVRAEFIRALKRAQDDREISADAQIEAIADFLMCGMNGLRTMIKAGIGHREARSIAGIIIGSIKK